MTDDPVVAVLRAELETGEELARSLERQREALVTRNIDRLGELTEIIEGQFAHFNTLMQTRERILGDAPALTDATAALLRQIARTEARIKELAELNQSLIADRLAYVGAMLSAIRPERGAAYSAGGQMRAQAALSRSA